MSTTDRRPTSKRTRRSARARLKDVTMLISALTPLLTALAPLIRALTSLVVAALR
ncbi:hypothetical protein ACWF0M_14090 [Kribbella sp. NPDC055110]